MSEPCLVESGADGEGGHVVVAGGGVGGVQHMAHRLVVRTDLRVDLLLRRAKSQPIANVIFIFSFRRVSQNSQFITIFRQFFQRLRQYRSHTNLNKSLEA